MIFANSWKESSRAFFDVRASELSELNLEGLCYVSGRDPRLWSDGEMYDDMIGSISEQADLKSNSQVVEIGCAAGFLASGICKTVERYVGFDVAPGAVRVANRLNIPNAAFYVSNGSKLPLEDESVDAAICYDVFTNFPDFSVGSEIIVEMLRIVKTGGAVLIGSVPDASKRKEFEQLAPVVTESLEKKYGKLPKNPTRPVNIYDRIRFWFRRADPQITCYYFCKNDFIKLGQDLNITVEIRDIHSLNPYYGYRFNVIFKK